MEEEQLCSGPRFYTGKPREISIFFERDPSYPALDATVQAYRSENNVDSGACLRKVDFPRDSVPSHISLKRWVEHQIQLENGPEFRQSVQNFLFQYSEHGLGLPKVWKTSLSHILLVLTESYSMILWSRCTR
jgi:hypothetical protein